MVVYVVESKIPEFDVEKTRVAKSSLTSARKEFKRRVNEIKESGEEGWCELNKITLTKTLSTKQLILAIMSDCGYAANQERIDQWYS